jgi:hypothetical protein
VTAQGDCANGGEEPDTNVVVMKVPAANGQSTPGWTVAVAEKACDLPVVGSAAGGLLQISCCNRCADRRCFSRLSFTKTAVQSLFIG